MIQVQHAVSGQWSRSGYTPPSLPTIFGFNTNEGDTFNQTLAGRQSWWGRAPMVRRYNSNFVPASWPVSNAVFPEGRISYSFKADASGSFTIAGLAAGNGNARFRSFIESIPAGKTVYLTYYHEVNDDIREGRITPAQFKATYGHLYGQLQAARAANSLAAGTTVKLCANFMAYRLTDRPTYFDDSWVPSHSQMDLLTFDIYGNPGELGASSTGSNTYGTATGPGYGTRYPLPSVRAQPMFDIIRRLGWAQKWGILEVNTPARSWDSNEASRARWFKDMYDLFLAQPYKPEVVLLWEAPSGVNWDQSFGRVAGSPNASVNALAPYIKGSP